MNLQDFEDIQPYVRMIKIKKNVYLDGAWDDIDHVLIYVAQGMVEYILDGKRYYMQAGDFILIPPYMNHLGIKKNADPLVQYIVHFDFYSDPERMKVPHQSASDLEVKYLIPEREEILKGRSFFASVCPKERFRFENLFLAMYRDFFQAEEGCMLMLRGEMLQLLILIIRCLAAQGEKQQESAQKKSKSWKLVENALEYIYLHYDEELDNEKISEAVDASPNYLSKLFQNYIGVSLHNYVLNFRLDRAQKLLASEKYNITEVAMKCGFSSVHAFSKVFKKKRGCNPGAYVEMMKSSGLMDVDKLDYDPKQRIYFNQ